MDITSAQFVTVAIVLSGVIFNAGISWAWLYQVRKEANGFRAWVKQHEKEQVSQLAEVTHSTLEHQHWADQQVRETSERIARLEAKQGG